MDTLLPGRLMAGLTWPTLWPLLLQFDVLIIDITVIITCIFMVIKDTF